MKLRTLKKKVLPIALCTAMAVGLTAGCGSSGDGGSNGGDSASNGDDPITITVFSQLANYSGEQTGWSADILKEKFNVVLNIIPDLNGTLQTRMEAGDLGDIVVFGDNGTDYQNAISAGLLYDWNEDDLLADYGPYIKENMSHALERNVC